MVEIDIQNIQVKIYHLTIFMEGMNCIPKVKNKEMEKTEFGSCQLSKIWISLRQE